MECSNPKSSRQLEYDHATPKMVSIPPARVPDRLHLRCAGEIRASSSVVNFLNGRVGSGTMDWFSPSANGTAAWDAICLRHAEDLRIMCMIWIPARATAADQKALNPASVAPVA